MLDVVEFLKVTPSPWTVVGLALILGAQLLNARMQSRSTVDVAAVRESVVNTHSTNLRDDVDALSVQVGHLASVVQSVNARMGELVERMGGLAEDLRISRREQLALSERVDHIG